MVVSHLGNDDQVMLGRGKVANLTVASTPRYLKDRQWHDGEPLFIRCNAWKNIAENAAESLTKGDRVIVTGRLRQRSFEVNDERCTVTELDVDEIGPSLRYAAAKPTKARPSNSSVAGRPTQGTQPNDEPPF
jgi:single-strand DNA-binding protein